MKKIAAILFFIFTFRVTAGENNFIYMGAGGEDSGKEDTIFDDGAKEMVKAFSQMRSSYKATIAFNGGHSKTEGIINKGFAGNDIRNGFSSTNYNGIIQDLIAKINQKPPAIGPGDKVMLMIDTHGAENNLHQTTHNICLATGKGIENFNTGSSDEQDNVNLDSLRELTNLAQKKKIKLAIIDGSCHSGNTLGIANDNTCVISASAPNQYATGFTDSFAREIKPGLSLEDIYLNARKVSDGVPFPMISSPIGKKVQKDLAGILPFLLYHDESEGLNKIDKYLENTASNEMICKREQEFTELFDLIKIIEHLKGKSSVEAKNIHFDQLRKKIKAYKNIQDRYLNKIKSLKISSDELDEETPILSANGDVYNYSKRELLTTDFSAAIKQAQKSAILSKNNEDADKYKDKVSLYLKCNEAKANLLNSKKYKEYQKVLKDISVDTNLVETKAREIADETNKVYNLYYHHLQDQFKSVPNPCADFKI